MTGEAAGLGWTGHALMDVGVAGVCAFAKRGCPEDVTLEDLDHVSDFLEEHYYDGKLLAYLTCVFNSASFVQPNEGVEKRAAFVARYLRSHRAVEPDPRVAGLRCAFSGGPAGAPLVRTHLPLFSGEGVLNFRPDGQTFVPVASSFAVALMFLPMACRRAEGRMLAVHADDPVMTLRFARRYLDDNRRLLALALPREKALVHDGYDREQAMWDAGKKTYKYADVKGPRSLVVSDLAAIGLDAGSDLRPKPVSLTAYLLSNSGLGPSLEMFTVPSTAVGFVLRAASPRTRAAWGRVTRRFYPLRERAGDDAPKKRGRGGSATGIAGRAGWTRNPAFEDLCGIFDAGFTDRQAAARWLRKYVLGRMEGAGRVAFHHDGARDWALAELFLQEVMGMKQARIEAIKRFADKVAGWIHQKNDRRLRRALVMGRPRELRSALLRAQRESAAPGGELLFGLDEFATVWLHEDGDEYVVRDLVCIRVNEKLHELGEPVDTLLEEAASEGNTDDATEEAR